MRASSSSVPADHVRQIVRREGCPASLLLWTASEVGRKQGRGFAIHDHKRAEAIRGGAMLNLNAFLAPLAELPVSGAAFRPHWTAPVRFGALPCCAADQVSGATGDATF